MKFSRPVTIMRARPELIDRISSLYNEGAHGLFPAFINIEYIVKTSPKPTRPIGICEIFFLVPFFSQTRKLPASPAAQSECCSNPSVISIPCDDDISQTKCLHRI